MNTSKRFFRRHRFGSSIALLCAFSVITIIALLAFGVDASTVFGTASTLAIAGAVLPDAEFQSKVLSGLELQNQKINRALAQIGSNQAVPRGLVSSGLARSLGATVMLEAINKGLLAHTEPKDVMRLMEASQKILGVTKTALTSADIALPVEYNNELVELVAEFGTARQYGTVFPLSKGKAKLGKIKTAPTFGRLVQSNEVANKVPQTEHVDFNAEKFGGLMLVPSEIYEDTIESFGVWLAVCCATQLAATEDRVFWVGDYNGGVDPIPGMTGDAEDAGTMHQLATTKTAPSDITLTDLRTLRSKVHSAALSRGSYYMHRTMEALLSGFNNNGSTFFTVGPMGPMLDGFPVRWVEALPVYSTGAAANQLQLLFGDARFGWLGITGNIRIDVSREAGFETDEIMVRGLERLDAHLMADQALAVLKLASV